ncbi:MAG: hypothetical protein AB1555_09310 [Nitrospirota bacterium]
MSLSLEILACYFFFFFFVLARFVLAFFELAFLFAATLSPPFFRCRPDDHEAVATTNSSRSQHGPLHT